jgi:DNA-binding response OmpR family regulator
VLIVDDEPGVVRLVRAALQGEGREVAVASNNAECLLAVDAKRPDLAILDVAMPVPGGFQTQCLLRDNAETPSIPVTMLTARKSDAEILQGWATGVDFHLTKSFEVRDLLAAIRRMLEIAGKGETLGQGDDGR